MKGKHAKASANRQDRQSLVDAAEQSKLRAARAEKERDEVLARTASQVEAAQQEAATAKRLLAEGSSPDIERLRGEVERLRGERDAAREAQEQIQDRWNRVVKRLVAFLSERFNVTPTQAMEALIEAMGGGEHNILDSQTVDAVKAGRLSDDQALAIERARGMRSATDLRLGSDAVA